MKLYLAAAFFLSMSTNSFAWGELQQKQLTKEIFFQYQNLEQNEDDSKKEIVFTNPRFTFMDTTKQTPIIAAEIDHKGIIRITIDRKNNLIESQSQGITRVLIPAGDEDNAPVEFSLQGVINKSLDIDLDNAEPIINKLKSGNISEENILTLLHSIRSSSAQGKGLKLQTADKDQDPFYIDWMKSKFVQATSGAMPEELTMQFATTQTLNYTGHSGIYKFPDITSLISNYDVKFKFADWSKFFNFAKNFREGSLPDGSIDFKMNSDSNISKGIIQGSFANKSIEGNRNTFDSQMHYEVQGTADSVRKLQNIHRTPRKNESNKDSDLALFETTLYEWLKSPKTTPFLSLIPLKITSDWKSSLEYSTKEDFSVDKAKLEYSGLGAEKNGLLANFDYQKGKVNAVVTLAGGQNLINYLADLYNAFLDSLKTDYNLPRLTEQDKNEIFNRLSGYAEQPLKSNELKFKIQYNDAGFKVGSSDATIFMMDLFMLNQRFMPKGNPSEPMDDEDQDQENSGWHNADKMPGKIQDKVHERELEPMPQR